MKNPDPYDTPPSYRLSGYSSLDGPDWDLDPSGEIYFCEDVDPLLKTLRGDGVSPVLRSGNMSVQVFDGTREDGSRFSPPYLYITFHHTECDGSIVNSCSISIVLKDGDSAVLRSMAAEVEGALWWQRRQAEKEKEKEERNHAQG